MRWLLLVVAALSVGCANESENESAEDSKSKEGAMIESVNGSDNPKDGLVTPGSR
jgi:hypothetical protein